MYITSQILIIIADIFFVLSCFTKNKKSLIFWLILSDVFFGAHYFFLGGITGAYIVMADIVFLILSTILNKKNNKAYMLYLSIIFAIISVVITILTMTLANAGTISLIAMAGMVIYYFGMAIDKLYVSKICNSLKNLCNIIYMFILASYVGAGLEIILMSCAIIGSIISYRKLKMLNTPTTQTTNVISSNDETNINVVDASNSNSKTKEDNLKKDNSDKNSNLDK